MIEETLRAKIGLNFDAIGRKGVEDVISRHMRKAGLSNERDFHALLTTSEKHFEELAEELLIPETWFFRYYESFAFLAKHVKELRAEHRGKLRILCVPCASGEEPYSIAITLVDAGITSEHFHVDAVDVSSSSLQRAQLATYGMNSFRGSVTPHILNRFFKGGNGQYEVIPEIKKNVDFRKANVLDPFFAAGCQPYDIIFCRNLLIYFPPEEQAQAIQILSSLLCDDGLLFLGHAESGILNRKEFVAVNHPSSFAFRKNTRQTMPTLPALKKESRHPVRPPPSHEKSVRKPTSATSGKIHDSKTVPAANNTATDSNTLLAKAAAYADSGDLQNAEALCMQYLAHDKLNPTAYFLLGVVCFSGGRLQDAESALSKAVYLNPGHYEALVNLALLKERKGDKAGAKKIRERAEHTAGKKA